jgi:hypothetical protein
VPWCETCSKYLAPTALNSDGTCPTCGAPVGEIEQRAEQVVADDVVADEGTPWHFKLLIGVVAIYLGWRTVQMIGWLI